MTRMQRLSQSTSSSLMGFLGRELLPRWMMLARTNIHWATCLFWAGPGLPNRRAILVREVARAAPRKNSPAKRNFRRGGFSEEEGVGEISGNQYCL